MLCIYCKWCVDNFCRNEFMYMFLDFMDHGVVYPSNLSNIVNVHGCRFFEKSGETNG